MGLALKFHLPLIYFKIRRNIQIFLWKPLIFFGALGGGENPPPEPAFPPWKIIKLVTVATEKANPEPRIA